MNNWYAVEFCADYADEFDVKQSFLIKNHIFDRFIIDVNESTEYPFEIYFGTNEYIEFENASNILRCFTIRGEAWNGFAKQYNRLFNGNREIGSTIGKADWLWNIWECVNPDLEIADE